jgi:hypothetical protein
VADSISTVYQSSSNVYDPLLSTETQTPSLSIEEKYNHFLYKISKISLDTKGPSRLCFQNKNKGHFEPRKLKN